jgi:hypothetical protein
MGAERLNATEPGCAHPITALNRKGVALAGAAPAGARMAAGRFDNARGL